MRKRCRGKTSSASSLDPSILPKTTGGRRPDALSDFCRDLLRKLAGGHQKRSTIVSEIAYALAGAGAGASPSGGAAAGTGTR
jgi:hypothetical protein